MFQRFFTDKKRLLRVGVVLLLTGVGLFLSFQKFHTRDLWSDELEQIRFMGEDVSLLVQEARRIMQFPGDYLLIYPFYKIFGTNKWGLAIPHILGSILGYYLLYRICQKYLKTIWGYGIAFLITAFNANLSYHAFEIRPYSGLATLGLASFLVMGAVVGKKDCSFQEKLLINLFTILALLYHLFGILILFTCYLFHLFCSRNNEGIKEVFLRNLKDFLGGFLVVFPLWVYFGIGPDKSYLQYDTFEFIPKGIISVTKGVVSNLVGFRPFYLFLPGVVVALCLPHRERKSQMIFLAVVVFLPIALILFSCIVYHYWFIQRLFIWVMPLFAFLLGWQWDSVICYGVGKFRGKV